MRDNFADTRKGPRLIANLMQQMHPIKQPHIAAVFASYPEAMRSKLLDLRTLIFLTLQRKPTSIWSVVNVNRVAVLTADGRMQPAGLVAFEARSHAKTGVYEFEQEAPELAAADICIFKKNHAAWKFFEAQPPGYRRQMSWRVTSAKREETRAKRLQILIDASASGIRLQ